MSGREGISFYTEVFLGSRSMGLESKGVFWLGQKLG